MESFGELLDSLRFRSQVTAVIELGQPWGLSFPEIEGSVKFHHVTAGSAEIIFPDSESLTLKAGDLVLIVNSGHRIASSKNAVCTDIHAALKSGEMSRTASSSFRFGGNGESTSIITGRFTFDYFETHPFFRLVPRLVVIRAEERKSDDGIDMILKLMLNEATAKHAGAKAAIDRLCDLLFFAAIRTWATQSAFDSGWAAVTRDAQIAAAVDVIHRESSTALSIEQLARAASLSRSAFAERFRHVMGEPPSSYLTRWRMHLASVAIRERGESIAAAAQQAGYESEAAFAKAFKRSVGVAPGAFRRTASA